VFITSLLTPSDRSRLGIYIPLSHRCRSSSERNGGKVPRPDSAIPASSENPPALRQTFRRLVEVYRTTVPIRKTSASAAPRYHLQRRIDPDPEIALTVWISSQTAATPPQPPYDAGYECEPPPDVRWPNRFSPSTFIYSLFAKFGSVGRSQGLHLTRVRHEWASPTVARQFGGNLSQSVNNRIQALLRELLIFTNESACLASLHVALATASPRSFSFR
jgi:hypothetical protein